MVDTHNFLNEAGDIEMGTSVCHFSLSISLKLAGLTFLLIPIRQLVPYPPNSEESMASYHQKHIVDVHRMAITISLPVQFLSFTIPDPQTHLKQDQTTIQLT